MVHKSGLVAMRRRTLLGAGALAMPFIGNAQAAEPIKIGLILAKTGAVVDQSEYLANGTFLALEEVGSQALGRPVELIWLDEPSPQVAQQNAQKLIEEHKVVALIGGALSSNALAVSSVAKRMKIPFVINNAAAREITGRDCNRYTFRLQPAVPVQARALAPYIMDFGKRWYLMTAAYAFGQDIKRTFTEILTAAGGTVSGADEVPLNTPDYSSYILKIRQAKPDLVIGGVPAQDLSTFLKQWNELGMKGKIPFAEIAVGDTDLWAVGPEAATGVFTSLWWYGNPDNPPEDRAMAVAHLKKYGKPAADKSWMGWFAMRSLLGAIELAKSTDPEAIVDGLENWRVMNGDVAMGYRKFDHQMMMRTLVIETKPVITDKWDYFNVKASLPVKASDLETVFGTQAEVGCTMSS